MALAKILNNTLGRLPVLGSLFLFGCTACSQKHNLNDEQIILNWKNQEAVSVLVPAQEDIRSLSVHLEQHTIPILGEWSYLHDTATFTPLVPFTQGKRYEVRRSNASIGQFHVRERDAEAPQILAIYPSGDTVPENLLKMFIQFSMPMSEGEAYQHLTVTDLDLGEPMAGTFLELEPELWNDDNTVLTLWLDPGRIKRGLIPNQEQGAPLQANRHYRLGISNAWRAKNRVPLTRSFFKNFTTISRDSLSPAPQTWKVASPLESSQPLLIDFGESLDAVLAVKALQITDADGNPIAGEARLLDNERVYQFLPENEWKSGKYTIEIENRLEDLAGNNVNQPFEVSVHSGNGAKVQDVTSLYFHIP